MAVDYKYKYTGGEAYPCLWRAYLIHLNPIYLRPINDLFYFRRHDPGQSQRPVTCLAPDADSDQTQPGEDR